MRLLLIKTSSMGDLIHTFPALTDAQKAHPDLSVDWVVEEALTDIPYWHPAVNRVIPVFLRRFRRELFKRHFLGEWRQFYRAVRETPYDLILDAQGLVKSAFLTRFAKGARVGLDWSSAREPLASLFYQNKLNVNFKQHAVTRMRQIFAQALHYDLPTTPPDFGLNRAQFQCGEEKPYLVFLHGTTWESKLWPEAYWIQLAQLAAKASLTVKISGGNAEELARAERIAAASPNVEMIPKKNLKEVVALLGSAKAVVAVDTGLAHLAAALSVPTISLYGPTNPAFTGALGSQSTLLAANFSCAPCYKRTCPIKSEFAVNPPCFQTLSPEKVWASLALS